MGDLAELQPKGKEEEDENGLPRRAHSRKKHGI